MLSLACNVLPSGRCVLFVGCSSLWLCSCVCRLFVVGWCLSVVVPRCLIIVGWWLLVVRCSLLLVGCWLLDVCVSCVR